MKKVLIVSYCYPPNPSICSSRSKGLAKYLPEFGWEPIVLTVNLPDDNSLKARLIKTPFPIHNSISLFKKGTNGNQKNTENILGNKIAKKNKKIFYEKMYNVLTEVLAYPDVQKSWNDYATEAGKTFLNKEKVDAIISTSSPLTCHLVAYNLNSSYSIPWVADLRDLWTQNHNYSYSFLRKYFEKKLELKTLSKAQALTTVSEPLAEKLKKFHKKEKVYSIPNGFDPEDVSTTETYDNKFSMTYTGAIYFGKQDPVPLFRAISELISQKKLQIEDLSIEFYGHNHGWLEEYIEKYELHNIVNLNGYVSREKAIEVQRKSQILLLLNWNDSKESEGIYTGKIFDYLAAGRPIISIGNCIEVVEELLDKTSAGIYASNIDEIKKEIQLKYDEFKREGMVKYNGKKLEIDKFSYREMARKYSEVLDNIS
ncbi:glycosyltransferase [Methanosarcina siciliae]|nr:glycosyltransferase [Methanosarcina siciliae]